MDLYNICVIYYIGMHREHNLSWTVILFIMQVVTHMTFSPNHMQKSIKCNHFTEILFFIFSI